jgi:membrane protease YdiL (CAAX protease family)
MISIQRFVKTRPLLTYYLLTFAISWGGGLVVLGPEGFLGLREPSQPEFLGGILSGIIGPSVAGALLTRFVDGRSGLRHLRSRLFKWQVAAHWYAVALLSGPLVSSVVLLLLRLNDRGFVPQILISDHKSSLLLLGVAAGSVIGFCEELGWTGFAVPRLRRHHGILTTGMIVGFLWGGWHFPIFSGASRSAGMPAALYLSVLLFSFLPPFRVLMVWLYDRTGSLFLAMIMHAGLSATSLILQPQTGGMAVVVYDLALAVTWWVLAAIVMGLSPKRLKGAEG